MTTEKKCYILFTATEFIVLHTIGKKDFLLTIK
mgnify:CR=1 FL=1